MAEPRTPWSLAGVGALSGLVTALAGSLIAGGGAWLAAGAIGAAAGALLTGFAALAIDAGGGPGRRRRTASGGLGEWAPADWSASPVRTTSGSGGGRGPTSNLAELVTAVGHRFADLASRQLTALDRVRPTSTTTALSSSEAAPLTARAPAGPSAAGAVAGPAGAGGMSASSLGATGAAADTGGGAGPGRGTGTGTPPSGPGERQATSSDALAAARRLALRSRRSAATLVALADLEHGNPPTADAAVTDLVEAALADNDQRDRIDTSSVQHAMVTGSAVVDLVHLVAELVDNAVEASDPSTKVAVIGRRAQDGYVVSVVDEGRGMAPTNREAANERLAHPPALSAQEPDALGLSVVGRLAARQGIAVTLLEAATDGVIAKVRVPLDLIDGGAGAAPSAFERSMAAFLADEQDADDVIDLRPEPAEAKAADVAGSAPSTKPALMGPERARGDEQGRARRREDEAQEASWRGLDEQVREQTATKLSGLGSADRPSRQGPNRRRPANG